MNMVDHSSLPSVADAKLPQTYERAKTAISECSRIDECKDWADKAQALASYARQAKDDSMRKMADRIQARAIARAGELLKQVKPGKTGPKPELQAGDHPQLTRTIAATEAGLSEHQRKTALRVANIPSDEFDRQVESDNPPTVTALAEQGKRQAVNLNGRNPDHFNKALHFIAAFDRHLKKCREYDIEQTVSVLSDDERDRLRKLISEIDSIHDQIITRI